MKKLIIFFFTIMINTAFAADFSGLVECAIHRTDPSLNIGIKVKNLDTGKIVYERNAKRYFMPGSLMKFISIVSFLEHFGSDYKFTSRVLKDGKDYYIDIHHPNFQIRDLKLMMEKIAEDAGSQIKGNIFIVNSKFTVPPIMREKSVSDTMYCNGALITKVHINKNCAKVNVRPTSFGEKIRVKSGKNFPYIIENNAKTIERNQLDRLHVVIDENKYVINGTLRRNAGLLPINAVTEDNLNNVKHYIRKDLSSRGVNIYDKISIKRIIPKSAETIYSSSIKFEKLADRAMKISDNYITDYFLAEYATQLKFNQWRQAIISMKHLIAKKFGVDLRKSEIFDASGISRRNLLTVNQVSDFLSSVAQSNNYQIIKSLMACPGDECTLRKRFKGVKDFYAKTGTLRHVSALVGYFKNSKEQNHSFVIMANNFYGYNTPYRNLEEKIVRIFIDN